MTAKLSRLFWLLSLLLLLAYSAHLALNRIYQVDEVQNVFMAKVIGQSQFDQLYVNPELFLFGPLAWIASYDHDSHHAFTISRLIFLAIFWLNILLTAYIIRKKVSGLSSIATIVIAASFPQVWDYGFEIRHDNIIVTGLLLIWLMLDKEKPTKGTATYVGMLACVLFFVTFKSIAYSALLIGCFLIHHAREKNISPISAIFYGLIGFFIAFIAIALFYKSTGLLDVFFQRIVEIQLTGVANSDARFPPWTTIARISEQSPLFTGLLLSAILYVTYEISRQITRFGKPKFPDTATIYFISTIILLFINPAPYAYNLVYVIPFGIICIAQFVARANINQVLHASSPALVLGIVLVCHVLPFISSTARHVHYTNWRQESLSKLAEQFTEKNVDAVYDATGLVINRKSVGYWWFLHSLNLSLVYKDSPAALANYFSRTPPVVLIPNYRFGWLSPQDRQYILENYFPLADDFWLLSRNLNKGSGLVDVPHPGRYQIIEELAGSWKPTDKFLLNGEPSHSSIIELSRGDAVFTTEEGSGALRLVWLGPKLNGLPQIGQGSAQRLYVNWY